MSGAVEMGNRISTPGFAKRVNYGSVPGTVIEENAGGKLQIRQRVVAVVRSLLRLSEYEVRQLLYKSRATVAARAPHLMGAYESFVETCSVDDPLLYGACLGINEGNHAEMHLRHLAKLYLFRGFILRQHSLYGGLLASTLWSRILERGGGSTPTVFLTRTSAMVGFDSPDSQPMFTENVDANGQQ
eukprot:2703091-Rhodomonas_salina.1